MNEPKNILLKKIELNNFMGIKHIEVDFSPTVTVIVGKNATGKTTLNTAFRWLLFNKDAADRKDFEIKTIDREGKVKHGLEHNVKAWLSINDKEIILSKTYKEIWRKKKGEKNKAFSGHETLYSIDDVPMLKKDYDAYLDDLISENDFKIITDPLYFSQQLHWKDARNILLDIVGDISDEEVFRKNTRITDLDLQNKIIEDFRKSVAAKRKKLNEEVQRIPTRIDEVEKSKRTENFTEIELELAECKRELRELDELLEETITEDPEVVEKKKELQKLQIKIEDYKNEEETNYRKEKYSLENEINKIKDKKVDLQRTADKLDSEINSMDAEIKQLDMQAAKLRKEWEEENDIEFTADIETTCPTCGQDLPEENLAEKIVEMQENFNYNKAEKLNQIERKGKDVVKLKEKLLKEQEDKKKYFEEYHSKAAAAIFDLEEAEIKLNKFLKTPKDTTDIEELEKKVAELKAEIAVDQTTNTEQHIRLSRIERRQQLIKEIDILKGVLIYKHVNEDADKRIEELKEQHSELAQKIADIEKQEYLSDEFVKTKVGLLETKINDKFQFVKFRLFETQVNGAIDEVCKALVQGVPFTDANRAAKVNAGIDIINTLSKHYNTTAPIWIDNRESITEIIKTDSQVINLIVDENYKTLTAINVRQSLKQQESLFGE